MKDFLQKVLPLSLATSVFLAACSGPNFTKNSYSVNPNPLEMRADSVSVVITGNVPPKSVKSSTVATFQPFLKTKDGKEIALKSVTLKGEKGKGTADYTINSKTGGKVVYSDKIPYTTDLKNVKLYPRFTVAEKPVKVSDSIMVLGTITTAGMLKFSNEYQLATDNYQPEISNKSVNIYFPMDVDKFNDNFKVGKSINNKTQINNLKVLLTKDPNWIVRGISINAYASPDGELERNSNLSKGRSTSTFAYFRKELKKLGFAEVNDSNFSMGYMLAEDWKGFANELASSNFADKDAMIAIVNNTNISDEDREAQLRKDHEKSWKKATEVILPKLRKSELVVIGNKPFKTEAELVTFTDKTDQLNNSELYHLSIITKDLKLKEVLLITCTMKASGDWRGFNDLAVVNLQNANLNDANINLITANELSANNGKVLANMGALYKAKGDLVNARTYYEQAAKNGANTYYNLGVYDVKSGNYASAVSNFGKSGKSDFNSALAQLLNGDANGAKTTIDNINPDELTWEHYYLRAICGARMNNQDVCTTNLAQAVAKNAEVRTMAKDDLEFVKFFNNPLFGAAIR
jgi:tetratricopeptide (TPR) repeat protein